MTGAPPSIDSETMSPATPVPEIVGVVVVVSIEPLAGLAIVGAAGALATLTVNVSVAAAEAAPPPGAAWVADRLWLPLPSGLVSA